MAIAPGCRASGSTTDGDAARDIRVSPNTATGILRGTEFWMSLQRLYEVRRAERETGRTLNAIPRRKADAA